MCDTLFKYLDFKGGLMMLQMGNLQFTNASQLNDPFDCHPSLINYSNVRNRAAEVWGKKLVEEVETNHAENRRDQTWICSLSKDCYSLLMWSYYCNHKGVCVGFDREKTRTCLKNIVQTIYIGALEMEVQYKEVVEKPDYFHDRLDFLKYQLSTKAKDWAHEQEVRFLLINPTPSPVPNHPSLVSMALSNDERYNQMKEIDYREVRAYYKLKPDCFESVYLGFNMPSQDRIKIIETARKLNPEIKIYQMKPDPEAYKLKANLV